MTNTKETFTEKIKKQIKVRLDHKTIIILKDMTKYDYWKSLYPKAVIIS